MKRRRIKWRQGCQVPSCQRNQTSRLAMLLSSISPLFLHSFTLVTISEICRVLKCMKAVLNLPPFQWVSAQSAYHGALLLFLSCPVFCCLSHNALAVNAFLAPTKALIHEGPNPNTHTHTHARTVGWRGWVGGCQGIPQGSSYPARQVPPILYWCVLWSQKVRLCNLVASITSLYTFDHSYAQTVKVCLSLVDLQGSLYTCTEHMNLALTCWNRLCLLGLQSTAWCQYYTV